MLSTILRLPTVITHTSIVSPDVLVPVDVIAAVLIVLTIALPARPWRTGGRPRPGGRPRSVGRRRSVGPSRSRAGTATRIAQRAAGMGAGAGLALLLCWWLGDVQDLFGIALTPVTRMWAVMVFAAFGLLVVVAVQGGRRLVLVAFSGFAVVALASGLGINVDFGAYKNLDQALSTDPYPTGTLAHEHGDPAAERASDVVATPSTWHAPAGMPSRGRVESVRIRGVVSHFRAREAVVYLPPAALTSRPPVLPVVIALSGQPGAPSDMFASGDIQAVMNAYARTHDGLAPIVVSPDQLGAPNRNPMCVDSRRLGRSATYVMTDTVRWIRDHFRVSDATDAWAMTGFSEGATCTMQFTAAHPAMFGEALAISSELMPRNGSPEHSAAVAFHGSAARYRAAGPLAIMAAHAPYVDHLTVLAYGQDDAPYRASTAALAAAARTDGMTVDRFDSPGSAHDWNTVRYALVHGMPEVLARMGIAR